MIVLRRGVRPLALLVLAACYAQPVAAQDGAPVPALDHVGHAHVAGDGPISDAVADHDPDAALPSTVVTVRLEQAGLANPDALANQPVSLHVVLPPQELVQTLQGRTDAAGEVTFTVPLVGAGLEAYAEINTQRRVFSDPVRLAADTPGLAILRMLATTEDPSVVEAARVITVMEPWEDFVIVQQVWTFDATGDTIWRPNVEEAGPGMAGRLVRISLPADAKGIRVVQPVEQTRVIGTTVFYGADVAPLAAGQLPPHLIVQYSMPLGGDHRMTFDQPFAIPVRDLSLVIPLRSQLQRHPVLDVDASAPLCADGATGDEVCFSVRTGDGTGLPSLLGTDLLVYRGGTARVGQRLVVQTWDWPYRVPWEKWAAGVAGVCMTLGGLGFLFRERRRRGVGSPHRSARAALTMEQAALLDAAVDLDQRLERGEMTAREHEAGRQQIAERLGALAKRLREVAGEAGGSPAPRDPTGL